MENGKHEGERITRVPMSYLRWMVRAGHPQAEYAQAELDRRGAAMPDIEISAHAIDRLSLRCRDVWHQTRKGDEGLYTWAARMALAAWQQGKTDGRYAHAGITWVIEGGSHPILTTAFPDKLSGGRRKRNRKKACTC